MNKHINQLITAVLNNRVVYADTNLKNFRDKFAELEPSFWKYHKLYSKLKNIDIIEFDVDDKKYFIQMIKAEDNGNF